MFYNCAVTRKDRLKRAQKQKQSEGRHGTLANEFGDQFEDFADVQRLSRADVGENKVRDDMMQALSQFGRGIYMCYFEEGRVIL